MYTIRDFFNAPNYFITLNDRHIELGIFLYVRELSTSGYSTSRDVYKVQIYWLTAIGAS